MDSRQIASPVTRLFLAVSLIFALTLAGVNLRWLLAEAYGQVAREHMLAGRSGVAIENTAKRAFELSPYSAYWRALHARALAARDPLAALDQFRDAVRNAPASAVLWQEFVRFKLSIGEYDDELEHAMRRVHELASYSAALHRANADLAMRYWHWGSPELRKLWVESIRITLKNDRDDLFHSILLNRQEEILCKESQLQMPETREWCKAAVTVRAVCHGRPIAPDAAGWCIGQGLLEESR